MIKIEYTEKALEEFESLIENIYQDKPKAAKSYFDRIEKAIENLAFSPLLGITCTKKKIKSDCRILIVDNYLVFYHYNEATALVKILHVVYGNVEYKKLF